MDSSYLELILGPMFSGKTSKLLEIYNKKKYCNEKILVINYTHDKRYSDTHLSSHDKIMIPCTQVTKLNSLYDLKTNIDHHKIKDYDVILINEGQFFDDLFIWVSYILDNFGKQIYICGLDGDYKRKKFGQMLDLIPLCDKVNKLNALCGHCKNGKPGIYSHRKTNEENQLLIGNDIYIPLCRECYKLYNKSI